MMYYTLQWICAVFFGMLWLKIMHICSMKKLLILLSLFVPIFANAQEKLLTIQDAITGYHLYPKGLYDLQWLPGGKAFSQVKRVESKLVLEIQEIRIPKGKTITVSLSDVNQALTDTSNRLERLPHAQWLNDHEFQFRTHNIAYAYHIYLKTVRKLPFNIEGASNPILFDNGKGYMAHVENGLNYGVNGHNHQIVSNTDGIVIGEAVHRSEFGITDGLFPSPKYTKLAYYEMDERMVTSYPLYQLNDTPATAKMLRYPTAGAKSHHVLVKVKNMR